jgi:subtilisin family serine protease
MNDFEPLDNLKSQQVISQSEIKDGLHEPTKIPNNPQFTQFGCTTAMILLGLGILICSGGNRWLFEPQSIFGRSFDSITSSTFISGTFHWLLLLVVGLLMLFMRRDNLRLARGIGAGLLVGAIYTVANSILIAWEAPLPYPGIPDLIPPIILIAIAAVLILIFNLGSLKSARVPALLGLGLGLLVTVPWAFTGSLGELGEMAVAVVDSLAFGLWLGLATSMVLYFDGPLQDPNESDSEDSIESSSKERHILWSTLAVAGFAGAMLPTFLAGRGGYVMSAVLLTPLITLTPLIAMITLWPQQLSTKNRWLPPAALGFSFMLVPLLFFEGIELEFMPEISLKMAAGLGFVSLFSLGCAAVWLIVHLITGSKGSIGRSLAVLVPAVLLISTGALTTTGGPWQTDTFFVVLADQADTGFAADMTNRNERVSAVYDTLVAHANDDQADIRQFLDNQSATYTSFYLINGIEVEGGPRLKRQLAQRPDVARILDSPHPRPERRWFTPLNDFSLDAGMPRESAPTEPVWGILEVNAPEVWSEFGVTGEGIIVGSADSGVEFTHPALINSYLGDVSNHDYTWFDPGVGSPIPADSGGHGTHTTGTIVGENGIGVAPGAKWIACRNLPKNLGNPADYIACMQFLFAPFPIGADAFADGDPLRGAHLTNNSWGCPPEEGCDGLTMGIGVHQLRNAGQLMVISNGNSGPACHTTGVPATNDDAFSVGALNPSGTMAGFSSRGPAVDYDGDLIIKPDIVAPGVDIVSSIPNDSYAPLQGTSMAGPHVAGVITLLWSAAPELIGDIDQTEQILIATARQINTTERCLDEKSGDDEQVSTASGHGIIDALAAVKMALGR